MKLWQTLALVVVAAAGSVAWDRWQSPTYALAAVRDNRTGEIALFRMHTRTGRMEIKTLNDRAATPWISIMDDGYQFETAQVPPVSQK